MSKRALLAAALSLILLSACGSASGNTPAPVPPTFEAGAVAVATSVGLLGETGAEGTGSATESALPERIWLEQPFGTDGTLAVLFYTEATAPCIRFLVSTTGAEPVSRCAAGRESLIVAQGVRQTSGGETFTIIVGRALDPAVATVAVQFNDTESQPVPVDDRGFILILPGQKLAFQAVPIDAFGNTVGGIIKF